MWGAMSGGRGSRGGSPVGAITVALLAPVAAGLMQMAISRSRESDADRGVRELIGSGDALARALERIETIG